MEETENSRVRVGGHTVEVVWDPERQLFSFHIYLASGEKETIQHEISNKKKRGREEGEEQRGNEQETEKKRAKIGEEDEGESGPNNISVLPPEILSLIFQYVHEDMGGGILKFVCHLWRNISKSLLSQEGRL